MSRASITLLIAATIPALSCAAAGALALTYHAKGGAELRARAQHTQGLTEASLAYRAAWFRCELLKGIPKDVCAAEAKAAEMRAQAEAQSSYRWTSTSRNDVRIAAAQGDYLVSMARCNAQSGNERHFCKRAARATQTEAVASALARGSL